MRDLKELTPPELLVLHGAISEELRERRITRSSNNPLGDLAEHLFCRALHWNQADPSMRDADATDQHGTRFQIKARRLTAHNKSRQLGALRDLPDKHFDVLAAALFREDYTVLRAALIPHSIVVEYARRVERTNSSRFILRDSVWTLPDVKDVTAQLQKAEAVWANGL